MSLSQQITAGIHSQIGTQSGGLHLKVSSVESETVIEEPYSVVSNSRFFEMIQAYG
jgi:hypothetical protein